VEQAVNSRGFEQVVKGIVFTDWLLKTTLTDWWRRAAVRNCTGSEGQWLGTALVVKGSG